MSAAVSNASLSCRSRILTLCFHRLSLLLTIAVKIYEYIYTHTYMHTYILHSIYIHKLVTSSAEVDSACSFATACAFDSAQEESAHSVACRKKASIAVLAWATTRCSHIQTGQEHGKSNIFITIKIFMYHTYNTVHTCIYTHTYIHILIHTKLSAAVGDVLLTLTALSLRRCSRSSLNLSSSWINLTRRNKEYLKSQ
jgi:hypothetical protein